MINPEDLFVRVRGIRLRYVDWRVNGPPLLLLHGDLRTSRSWDAVARELYKKYHVISLDMRGHGDSDWTPRGYSFAERVEDLAAFCQEIGLRDAIGVGHSTGGVVMTLCAERYPGMFSRLVLLEPMVVVDERFQRMVSGRANAPRSTWASRQELYEYLKGHSVAGRWREDVIRDVVEHETMELPDGSIDMKWATDAFNWEDREGDHYDLKPIFRSLGLPILFITSQERKANFEDLHSVPEDIPGFHILTLQNTGHNMYMERPDAVAHAIEAFSDGRALPEVV